MSTETAAGTTKTPPEENEQTLSKVCHLVKTLSRSEQQELLCKLICELHGERLEKEVPIFADGKELLAYLLPPGLFIQLDLLGKPKMAEELQRRSQAPAKNLLTDVIKKLQADHA